MRGVAVHGHLGGEQVVDEAQLAIVRLLRENVQRRPGPRMLVVRAERERLGVGAVFPQEVEQCAPVPSHALKEESVRQVLPGGQAPRSAIQTRG